MWYSIPYIFLVKYCKFLRNKCLIWSTCNELLLLLKPSIYSMAMLFNTFQWEYNSICFYFVFFKSILLRGYFSLVFNPIYFYFQWEWRLNKWITKAKTLEFNQKYFVNFDPSALLITTWSCTSVSIILQVSLKEKNIHF